MAELKSCPFCGKTNIAIWTTQYGVIVGCFDCGASVKSYRGDDKVYKTLKAAKCANENKAIQMWNRRADT